MMNSDLLVIDRQLDSLWVGLGEAMFADLRLDRQERFIDVEPVTLHGRSYGCNIHP